MQCSDSPGARGSKKIPGGKKLVYTKQNIKLRGPLYSFKELRELKCFVLLYSKKIRIFFIVPDFCLKKKKQLRHENHHT